MKFGILLLAAFIFVASATKCLSRVNPVSKGQPCSSTSTCKYGTFCSDDGVCEVVLGEGESCKLKEECDSTLFLNCQGPENKKMCVKTANPGEQCSIDPLSTIPMCPYSCINNVCQHALVGDGCTANSDCFEALTCQDSSIKDQKVCTGLNDGLNCTTSYQCHPGSYCSLGFCNVKKTTGPCEILGDECAYGYLCMKNSADDDRQCILKETKLAGEYCDGNPFACQSLRCSSNYCATKSSDVCYGSGDCSADETCRCGGDLILSGTSSTCSRNPCYSLSEKYSECHEANCHSTTYFEKSCVQLFCKKQHDAIYKCSGVSRVVLSSITLLLAFIALFLF